jgi:prepilin-type N-terminal cleavage/methylation domain-containing protein
MPSSDSCRHRSERAAAGGFTLLELLVVLALASFVFGLALPRLDTIYLRMLFWLQRDQVERQLADLGARAYLASKPLRLTSWPPPVVRGRVVEVDPDVVRLDLPEGWRLVVEPAIEFRPNGACSGGKVVLEFGDLKQEYRMDPPRCRLR